MSFPVWPPDLIATQPQWAREHYFGYGTALALIQINTGLPMTLHHTGNGCYALRGVISTGHELLITDASEGFGNLTPFYHRDSPAGTSGFIPQRDWGFAVSLYAPGSDHSEEPEVLVCDIIHANDLYTLVLAAVRELINQQSKGA